MRYLLLAVILPAFTAQDNEAEKLFRDLEKKVAQAKTVRIAFAGKLTGDKKASGQLKGTVSLAAGDKIRLEAKGQMQGMDIAIEMVSDGKKLKILATPPGKENEEALPRKFGATMRTGLVRVGVTAGMLITHPRQPGKEEEPDVEKLLRVSDFQLAKKAKVEGRDAHVLSYKAALKDGPVLSVKLWLDAKTHLPLKREVSAEKDNQPIRVVETYSEFSVGDEGDGKSSQKFPAPPK